MQTQKMSLANIKGKLSRDEMKKIMAGSGDVTCSFKVCTTDDDCSSDCKCAQGGTSKFCSSPR